MSSRLAALMLVGALLWGCAAEMTAPVESRRITQEDTDGPTPWGLHVVAADKLGQFNRFIYRGDYRCQRDEDGPRLAPDDDGFVGCQVATVVNHLERQIGDFPERGIFRGRGCEGRNFTLMLFVHGGLNETGNALDRVRRDTGRILDDCVFPLFLNWESGFFSSYGDQVLNVRAGQRIDMRLVQSDPSQRERIGYYLNRVRAVEAPIYVVSDLLESLARAPAAWTAQGIQLFKDFFAKPVNLESEEDLYRRSAAVSHLWQGISKENNVYIQGGSDLDRNILGSALALTLSPMRIVLTPLADSFGETTWNNLLRTTFAAFVPDKDFVAEEFSYLRGQPVTDAAPDRDPVCAVEERQTYHEPQGVFSDLARRLQDLLCKIPSERDQPLHRTIKVNLVAHSMGTIIANEMVASIDLAYDNIVYMGAASSIRHFGLTVVPYIRRRLLGAGSGEPGVEDPAGHIVRFYNLMLHPEREARETNLRGAAPAGSLLVWIDTMYEHTDSAVDRTLGSWVNVRPTKWLLLEDAQRQIFFKIFGQADGVPTAHGQFSDLFCQTDAVTFAYWDELSWGTAALFAEDPQPPVPSNACGAGTS